MSERDENCRTLKKFWIGRHGSIGLWKIKLLTELSPAQQLFAALLRQDAEGVAWLLSSNNVSHWYREFFYLVRKNGFASTIMHLLGECRLRERIERAYRLADHSVDERLQRFLFKKFRRLAIAERIASEALERHLRRTLDALSEWNNEIVWIKGTASARSVYPRAEHRLHGDLDCVVRPDVFQQCVKRLNEQLKYNAASSPGACDQVGCGPTTSIDDLLLSPTPALTRAGPLSLVAPQATGMVDFKVNPYCRGLPMIEIDRFYAESMLTTWQGRTLRVPTLIDQLSITLLNFVERERFANWRCLYDIHLLVCKINEQPSLWSEFLRSCRVEAIELVAWAGLALAIDRLSSAVPSEVMRELKPTGCNPARFALAFTAHPELSWNSSSMLSMCLTSLISTDWKRRLFCLGQAMLPSRHFLQQYYGSTMRQPWIIYLLLHWLVMFLPGGIIRRTFGAIVWANTPLAWSNNSNVPASDL